MKKIIALFTAMAFALTLGVAFAQERQLLRQTAAEAAPEKKQKEGTEEERSKKKAARKGRPI